VDDSLLWVGAGLAMVAAVLLAFVPRLPAQHDAATPRAWWRRAAGTNRRLRLFATTQVAFSFLLLVGAGMLVTALLARQATETGYDTRQVLAIDVPTSTVGVRDAKEIDLHQQIAHRISDLPGVESTAIGSFVPWRDAGSFGPGVQFDAEGFTPDDGQENPHARFRIVSPGFFSTLGVSLVRGRDFTAEDRPGNEPVAIVSQSVADRLFPDGDVLNKKVWWTDPYFAKALPRRVVGVVADVDDENVVPRSAMAIYHPVRQIGVAGRLFVRTSGDPYLVVSSVTRIIHDMATNQPVERAATLEDVRAGVMASERMNAFVFAGIAGVALLIAVVGVAGVLAFSVSARTHEFGVRLAIGSSPKQLLVSVLSEGAVIAAIGIAAGAAGVYVLDRIVESYLGIVHTMGVLPITAAALVLGTAALLASILPAARASRVDVLRALRSE